MPAELIAHLLRHLAAKDLGKVATVCHAMAEAHVPAGLRQRYMMLGYDPPVLRPGESVFEALHFTESVAARPRCTLSADTCHTIFAGADGAVYSWGGHEHGPDDGEDDDAAGGPEDDEPRCWLFHLGHGRETGPCVRAPAPMCSLGGLAIREVAAGYEHSLMLSACGRVWSCGVGEYGRLGHGNVQNFSRPRLIEASLTFNQGALNAIGNAAVGNAAVGRPSAVLTSCIVPFQNVVQVSKG